jgi:hypothetical protein
MNTEWEQSHSFGLLVVRLDIGAAAWVFWRGDGKGDGVFDVGAAVYLINHLHGSDAAPYRLALGDRGCDRMINARDIVYLVNDPDRGGPARSC